MNLLVGAISDQGSQAWLHYWPREQLEQWPHFGPQHLFESNSNNGPSQAILILECWRLPQLVLSPPLWFYYFSRQNAMRRALSELKVFNKNCLTTPHLLCCTHRLTMFHLSSQKRSNVLVLALAIHINWGSVVIKQINMTSFITRNRNSTITFAVMLTSCVFLVT